MYEIKATPQQLDASASTIEENANTIRTEIQSVEELLNALRATFLGNRASAFFQQFDQARDDMEQWDDVVISFAQQLRTAAQRLRAADNAGG